MITEEAFMDIVALHRQGHSMRFIEHGGLWGTSPAIMQFETFAQLLDEPFVAGMITSPKPRSRVTFKYAQGPIAQGNSERPDVGFRFNTINQPRPKGRGMTAECSGQFYRSKLRGIEPGLI